MIKRLMQNVRKRNMRILAVLTMVGILCPAVLDARIRCLRSTVCIETEKNENDVYIYGQNKNRHKVTLQIDVAKQNMEADIPLPAVFVIDAYDKRLLCTLRHGEKRWHYRYTYNWRSGDMHADHDDTYVYRLPCASGTTHQVSQSCNGDFTHFGKSQYAIDFEMPVGTAIFSTREGVVVDIKDDSNRGRIADDFKDDANFVIIEHSDGTLGGYYHLEFKGVSVSIGEYVSAHEILGLSGNTGYSRGPHLHFVISAPKDGERLISFPAQFLTADGVVTCPAVDSYLTAD